MNKNQIFNMLDINKERFDRATIGMNEGRHNFILQEGDHLTKDCYECRITFIPDQYIEGGWGKFFKIKKIIHGAMHDFQNIVVCERVR